MTKESTIQKNILDYINSLNNAKAINIQAPNVENGTPDIFAVIYGEPILFEVKRDDSSYEASKLQQYRIDQWRSAGASVAIVKNKAQVEAIIEEWQCK